MPVHQSVDDDEPEKSGGIPETHSPYLLKIVAMMVAMSTLVTASTHESLLTRRAVAIVLHVCTKTVDRLVARGELPCHHIGRAVRFDVSDVNSYIERCRVAIADRAHEEAPAV